MLTGQQIVEEYHRSKIRISQFDLDCVNPNSVNLHLGSKLLTYKAMWLDMALDNSTEELPLEKGGTWLHPGNLYLGSTTEVVGSDFYVPMVEGRSSLARLGLVIHQTGGFIDIGFHGHITLELSVVQPLKIYPDIAICQVCFFRPEGAITLYKGKYTNQHGPTASRMHQELNTSKILKDAQV